MKEKERLAYTFYRVYQPLFYFIGNSYKAKSPSGRIALRRKRILSQMRPAAGGESCKQDSFSTTTILIQTE